MLITSFPNGIKPRQSERCRAKFSTMYTNLNQHSCFLIFSCIFKPRLKLKLLPDRLFKWTDFMYVHTKYNEYPRLRYSVFLRGTRARIIIVMFEKGTCIQCTLPRLALTRVRLCRVGVIRTRITVTSSNILNLSTDYKRYRHSSTDTKLIRLGFVIRTRITCIRPRIANDICIRVRITGIRVRIAMRGRLAEVVLGCSGHYIDPLDVQFIELDISSAIGSRTRIGIRARDTWLELGCPDTKTDPIRDICAAQQKPLTKVKLCLQLKLQSPIRK